MKIVRIETFPTRVPLRPERRMVSALGHQEVSDYLLLRVTTDNGLEGVGEATVMPRWSGETVWGAQALVEDVFTPSLLGRDPRDLETIVARMDALAVHNGFAKSAIEMACWDLAGKEAGVPVYALLGGPCRPRALPSRFSLGAYAPETAARLAAERVAAGFRVIKIKVGGDPDLDVARVRAVREAVGPAIELLIDANGGWDRATARLALRRMEPLDLSYVEQPVPARDFDGLRRLRQELGCRILADESCFDLLEARELLRQECCDAISVYPGKNGGISKSVTIVQLAEQHGIPCTLGSNLEWDVATAASGHLAVACANIQLETLPGDLLGPAYHATSLAATPLRIEGQMTFVPDRPGLGVDLDWPRVEAHRLSRR